MYVYLVFDESKNTLGIFSDAISAYQSIMSNPKFADVKFKEKGDIDQLATWWEKDGTALFIICSFSAKRPTSIGRKGVVYSIVQREFAIKRMVLS